MELIAAGRQTAAPFALCPGHHLLAVGMAAQGRGDAERRASRVDVLRLLRPSGENPLGEPLQVDCLLGAPGLCRLAWSAAPTEPGFTFAEHELQQAGLLAEGFDDGTVRIWNPEPALLWDLGVGVPEKPKAAWRSHDDPETALTLEANIPAIISDMYANIRETKWPSNDDDWKAWFNSTLSEDLELYPCPEVHYGANMELLTECNILKGPVLGLSFNDLHPYWIGTAALGESIYVHDISYPARLCQSTCEPGESVTDDATLDDDVVAEILLRLAPVSVLRSRVVCKAWHRITTDPSFLAAHADRRPAELLVVSRGKPSFLDAIPLSLQVDDLTRRRSQLHCPKHCEVGALMGSCDGLLLFQKSRESLFGSGFFVCNPVTRQGARLDVKPPSCPDLARLCRFYRHGPSGEHRLLVLANANEPEPGLAAHYVYSLAAAVTASSQLPRRLGPVADGVVLDEFTYFIDHYAHHRGKIHWTIHPLARSTEKILAFDTVSEDFRLISRPPWPRDHYCNEDLYLLELDGKLAVTTTELHGDSTELWVLEDYDDDQSWSHRFRIDLPPLFSPHWWTGTGVPNVVFVASYLHNFKAPYHLTEKRIIKQIEFVNGTPVFCYLFKDSLVPHAFLNPY